MYYENKSIYKYKIKSLAVCDLIYYNFKFLIMAKYSQLQLFQQLYFSCIPPIQIISNNNNFPDKDKYSKTKTVKSFFHVHII